jgi:hypothetical protein
MDMSDRLEIWARTADWALPVYGAILAVGLTVSGVAIARAAGVPDRAGTVAFADEVTV